jgi:hypothetical protein
MRGNETMRKHGERAGRALVVGSVAFALAACDLAVVNPGAITDESLDDPTLMDRVVNGVAQEFNQISDNVSFDILILSDEAAGSGSYFQTGRYRRGMQDWEETQPRWAQIHETIWTGQAAWYRMGNLDGFDRDANIDAARLWLMVGHAQRIFGETFCQVAYSVGDNPEEPQLGGVLPREAAFDSAVVALNRAITIAQAVGGGLADSIVTTAHAGLAQAAVGKGDFATAITHSVQVPTAFVREAHFNPSSNENLIFNETHDRAEIGLYNTYAGSLAVQDPRVPYTVCGTFDDPLNPKNSPVTSTGACETRVGADGVTAHLRQEKYAEVNGDSEIPYATGVDMRLIEAEAALLADDMLTFEARINEVRSHYGLGDLTGTPTTAGTLEYPNAYDANTGEVSDPGVDAWSILDAERHLTLWGEGRRQFDLHRWDHPFLDGGIVFWDSEPRRVSCWPVPRDECTLNQTLRESNPALMTGFGSETQPCS